ncbi:hypothetical protein M8494_03695 [Serratia ureilytica]
MDLAMYFGNCPRGGIWTRPLRRIDGADSVRRSTPPHIACTMRRKNLAHCTLLHDRYNSGEDEWQNRSQHLRWG